jgi:hypothetical protein
MRHLSTALVITLALVGQYSDVARADEVLPETPMALPELFWPEAPDPAASVPSDEKPLPVFAAYDDQPYELLSQTVRAPGLQFSLDPDNEELFVGWEFAF